MQPLSDSDTSMQPQIQIHHRRILRSLTPSPTDSRCSASILTLTPSLILVIILCLLLPPPVTASLPYTGQILDLDDASFDENLVGREIVVEFYAPWCGQCRKFEPIYKKWASSLWSRSKSDPLRSIIVARVDSTLNPDITSRAGVQGFPTIQFYRRGIHIEDFSLNRERSEAELTKWVQRISEKTKKAGIDSSTSIKTDGQRQRIEQTHGSQQHQPASSSSPSSKPSSTSDDDASLSRLKDLILSQLHDLFLDAESDPSKIDEKQFRRLWDDLLQFPMAMFHSRPYTVLMIVYACGIFQGLFFGVLLALREKRR